MQILRDTLTRLVIGPATAYAGLTMFPLVGDAGRRPEYATLDEAIDQGSLEIREVSQAGSVPELTVANKGDRAVFLLDGEELVGAKQNRVLNLTILVPAGKTLVVPVSCVEQGRWASRSAVMSSSGSTLYSKLRLFKLRSVSRNMTTSGSRNSDQAAVWAELAGKADEMQVQSPTSAMSDLYEHRSRSIEDFVSAFAPVEGQCGALFAIGDRPTGFELFEHPEVLRKMLGKIVRSYAMDAIGTRESDKAPTEESARAFVDEVAAARHEAFPGIGLGEDVRISGAGVTGAALVADDHVVHLCAFRTDGESDEQDGSRGSRILRASLRRR